MKMSHCLMLLAAVFAAAGCNSAKPEAAKATPPAKVDHPGNEQALNTLTLTPKAIERLGIETAEVREATGDRRRKVGGEVIIPTGQLIIVSAPLAGTLAPPPMGELLPPGSKLAAGQAVFDFLPLLTPEREVLAPADRIRVAQTKVDLAAAKIEADRVLSAAKVQVELAQLASDRARQLLANKAGSQRVVEETAGQLKIAQEAETAATARAKFLADIQLDEAAGQLQRRPIVAPVAGVLQKIDAAPGETVAAGKPLFQVARLDRLWIRVPVYVGRRNEIAFDKPALVTEFGQPGATARTATYAAAPPSADPIAATVDFVYAFDNADHGLEPGQKVSVSLPLKSQAAMQVVPAAAILYDVLGGAWVYERTGDATFVRRRVEVAATIDGEVQLAAGPPVGTKVVTAGAAELFGTEFGIGK